MQRLRCLGEDNQGVEILGLLNALPSLGRHEDEADEGLEGCFVYTAHRVYRCVPDVDPVVAFHDILRQGLRSSEAEPLGKVCSKKEGEREREKTRERENERKDETFPVVEMMVLLLNDNLRSLRARNEEEKEL